MKISILAERLLEAIKETARVAQKSDGLPILTNVLLETHEGRLAVTASDLEQTVVAYVGAQVHEEGACAVSSSILKKMLTKIKGDRIDLTGDARGATLDIDGCILKLEGADPEDYPPTPSEFASDAKVDEVLLKERLQKAVICAASDDTRLMLVGVHLVGEDGVLTLETTDGYRLARFVLPYSGTDINCIVHHRTISTLIRLLRDDEVTIDISDTAIRFRLRAYDVVSRLIKGDFPDTNQIVPTEWDRTVTVQPKELLQELEAALAIADKEVVRLITGEEMLTVLAKGEGSTISYQATISASIDGEQGKFSVNGRLLSEMIQQYDDPIFLQWSSLSRQARISDGDDGLYVLMPMVVEWSEKDTVIEARKRTPPKDVSVSPTPTRKRRKQAGDLFID